MTVKQADLKAQQPSEGVLRKFDEFFSPQTPSQPIQSLKPNSEPKQIALRCPISEAVNQGYCGKEQCAMWIVTYQRCCFVSIAKALDIISSILDDRLGDIHT